MNDFLDFQDRPNPENENATKDEAPSAEVEAEGTLPVIQPTIHSQIEISGGKTPIFQDGNCYKKKVKNTQVVKLSNFRFRFRYRLVDDNAKSTREIFIVDESGNECGPINIDSGSLVNPKQFREKMLEHGNFFLHCSESDFQKIIKHVIKNTRDKVVKIPRITGRIEKNTWIFDGAAIMDGKYVPANSDGFVFASDGTGYSVKHGQHKVSINTVPIDIPELFEKLFRLYGPNTVKLIGFIVATTFLDEIVKRLRCFPLLFIVGSMGTGKSKCAELDLSLVGMHRQSAVNLGNKSTQIGINRTLSKYSNLPVWMNEYQANERVDSLIMAIFDREGRVKAKKDYSYDVIEDELNGTAIITSEFVLRREALASRCVFVNLNNLSHDDPELFYELYQNRDAHSHFLLALLGKNIDIMTEIDSVLQTIEDSNPSPEIENRNKEIHAMVYGAFIGFAKAFGIPIPEEIGRWLSDDMVVNHSMVSDSGYLARFWELVQNCWDKGFLEKSAFIKDGFLFFNLAQVYEEVKKLDNQSEKSLATTAKDLETRLLASGCERMPNSVHNPNSQDKMRALKISLDLLNIDLKDKT